MCARANSIHGTAIVCDHLLPSRSAQLFLLLIWCGSICGGVVSSVYITQIYLSLHDRYASMFAGHLIKMILSQGICLIFVWFYSWQFFWLIKCSFGKCIFVVLRKTSLEDATSSLPPCILRSSEVYQGRCCFYMALPRSHLGLGRCHSMVEGRWKCAFDRGDG